MEEQLVSYKTVLLAKKKGIDFRDKIFPRVCFKAGTYHAYITQALLQKYLREVHNILVDVVAFYDNDKLPLSKDNLQKPKGYFYWDYYNETFTEENAIKFDTYEKALEYGLQEALKLIKK